MDEKYKQPGWAFYPVWVTLSTIAIPFALGGTFEVLSLCERWIGDWVVVNGQKHTTQDYFFSFFLPPMIWLFTSVLQYVLLRRYLPKMGWWILATCVGGLFAVALIYFISFSLGGIYLPTWSIGLPSIVISFFQWLVLRLRLPHAGWWILANALGASIPALIGMPFNAAQYIISIGFFPSLATAPVWWYLFRKKSQTVETQTVAL